MRDAVQEHAELHLLRLAAFLGTMGPDPLPREYVRAEIDAERRERFELAAQTYVAVGVLSEAEVAPSRERLEQELARGVPGPPVLVDEQLSQRARAVLQSRLDGFAAQPASSVESFTRLWQICADVRVLDRDELDAHAARLREVDEGRTIGLSRGPFARRCNLTELVAVVAGPASTRGPLRVLAVELYADAVVVRWHWHGRSRSPRTDDVLPAGARFAPPDTVALTDDLGGVYVHVGSPQRGHFARSWTAGQSTFATAVAAPATELVFSVGGEQVAIALPRVEADA